MLPIPIIQAIKKKAQERLNKVFAEYFPGTEPPRLTDGTVRIILEVFTEKEIAGPDQERSFALPCGCELQVDKTEGFFFDAEKCSEEHNFFRYSQAASGLYYFTAIKRSEAE